MEKKAYVKPVMESETFVPNTYIAACGDSGTHYYFVCNASHLIGGAGGAVYEETNDQPGLQLPYFHKNGDKYRSPYTPCSEKHVANKSDVFIDGYVTWGVVEDLATPVKIWGGPDGNNTHCTTNIHMKDWETAKS